MNRANALILFTLGLAMVAAPHAAPTWFPSTAIDGSSTRALWMSVVGAAQAGLAALWLAREAVGQAWQRIAATPARVQPQREMDGIEETMLTTPVVTAGVREPEGSITLHGEYAELWRAFQTALQSAGPAAQMAERAVAMARGEFEPGGQNAPDIAFEWTQADPTHQSQHERRLAA